MRRNKSFTKKIDLEQASVFLRADGIIHVHIKADADMQLDDAVKAVDAMGKIGEGRKYPVLIDAGEYAHIDKAVRVFSASQKGSPFTIADAIVYHSFAQKLLADFYINHNKPVVPTKSFSNTSDAIEWLKEKEKWTGDNFNQIQNQ